MYCLQADSTISQACRRSAIQRVRLHSRRGETDCDSDGSAERSDTSSAVESMLQRSCGCFDVGVKAFKLLTSRPKSKFAIPPATPGPRCSLRIRRTILPTTTSAHDPDKGVADDENTPPVANNNNIPKTRRRLFTYIPKTKYANSYFDEKGVYWPSTAKKRRLTPAEKADSAAAKEEKKRQTGCRYFVFMS